MFEVDQDAIHAGCLGISHDFNTPRVPYGHSTDDLTVLELAFHVVGAGALLDGVLLLRHVGVFSVAGNKLTSI